jgi:MFS family permease
MPEKFDPFDLDALERSLNDSATRVSTIWVSFLIFSLYLLIAAATVDHRQLLLAEPVKLPVLNIELPLWGFFFLAPVLFVIFHAYVLLQLLLLARTAAAYNDAVEKAQERHSPTPEEEALLRQRLANTIFAQIFAGSPRERKGWLGWLLKSMAWITLVIAPILILFVFQFSFLPYHSHLVTWTHRFLIAMELAGALVLWPLVLDARRDFKWTEL